jgi:fatty acid desaturase
MARQKSLPPAIWVVVVGNFLLFGTCLCCSGSGLVVGQAIGDGSSFAADPKQKEQIQTQQEELKRELPHAKSINMVFTIFSILCSIIVIAATIGLLLRKQWGWWLCLIGAAIMAVISGVHLLHTAVYQTPVQLRLQQEQMKKQNAPPGMPGTGFFQGIGYGTLGCMALFVVGYPALAIALLLMPSVRQAYTPRRRRVVEEYDEEVDGDDDYDDRRDDDYDDR